MHSHCRSWVIDDRPIPCRRRSMSVVAPIATFQGIIPKGREGPITSFCPAENSEPFSPSPTNHAMALRCRERAPSTTSSPDLCTAAISISIRSLCLGGRGIRIKVEASVHSTMSLITTTVVRPRLSFNSIRSRCAPGGTSASGISIPSPLVYLRSRSVRSIGVSFK